MFKLNSKVCDDVTLVVHKALSFIIKILDFESLINALLVLATIYLTY